MPDDDDIDDAQTQRVYSRMIDSMLEITAPLSNATLSMIYRVLLISLALDLLHNNLWLMLIALVLMVFSLLGIYLRYLSGAQKLITPQHGYVTAAKIPFIMSATTPCDSEQ